MKKYKKMLGISENATETEVKRAYRSQVKKWHPDKGSVGDDKIKEINEAFEKIMKHDFGKSDVWHDYSKWWYTQFGNDPIWGNTTLEKAKKPAISSTVDDFLDKHNIFAVVGASRDPKKYGHKVFLDLKANGCRVFAVNPKLDLIEGDKCYPCLSELPRLPDVVITVVPPKINEKIVDQAIKLGIRKIWFQPGSESQGLTEKCLKNGIQTLSKVCIMLENEKISRVDQGRK